MFERDTTEMNVTIIGKPNTAAPHHEKQKSEMRSFKGNENIHKKEGGSYYVVSANKA